MKWIILTSPNLVLIIAPRVHPWIPMSTLLHPLTMSFISLPNTLVGRVLGMIHECVAGTEEGATFSRAVDLLRREQDNEIGYKLCQWC